jgi:hypothetical protein
LLHTCSRCQRSSLIQHLRSSHEYFFHISPISSHILIDVLPAPTAYYHIPMLPLLAFSVMICTLYPELLYKHPQDRTF